MENREKLRNAVGFITIALILMHNSPYLSGRDYECDATIIDKKLSTPIITLPCIMLYRKSILGIDRYELFIKGLLHM